MSVEFNTAAICSLNLRYETGPVSDFWKSSRVTAWLRLKQVEAGKATSTVLCHSKRFRQRTRTSNPADQMPRHATQP